MFVSRFSLVLTELAVVAGLAALPGTWPPFADEGRSGGGDASLAQAVSPAEADGQGWFNRP